MAWCLIRDKALAFKKALVSGEINPAKLADMSSQERRDFLEKYVGKENSHNVNALFESKLLLKNQKAGYISWAKRVGGMTPEARRDVISRIEKMETILTPKDEKSFLKDLADKRLGIGVTKDEANRIFELSTNIQKAREDVVTAETKGNAKEVSRARNTMGEHIYHLITYMDKVSPSSKNLVTNLVNLPHAMVASLDFSAPFKHGFFSMSDPAWIKNFVKIPAFAAKESSYAKQMGKVYGNKYYDTLTRSGLHIFKVSGDLSKREEQFASRFIDKIPAFRGSARAYSGFLNGLRIDMASKMMKGAELRGDDVSAQSRTVKSIVKAVNDLTAASELPGGMERSANAWSSVIFSPRMNVARFNMLNPVTYLNPKYTLNSRIYMMKHLIGSAAIASTALGLASMAGLQIGTNPKQTDFGQIHVGDSKIDTTGGNRTLITFLARILSGEYISNAGRLTQLGIGAYKPLTRLDLGVSYAISKLAPGMASLMADFLDQANGKNPYGQPVTIPDEIKKQLTPLYINDGMEMFANDQNNTALALTLGLFGISVSPPSAAAKQANDWNNSQSKVLTDFKNSVDPQTFQQANDTYNQKVTDYTQRLESSQEYKDMSTSDQASLITRLKSTIQKQVLKDNGYTYQKQQGSQDSKDLINSVVNP